MHCPDAVSSRARSWSSPDALLSRLFSRLKSRIFLAMAQNTKIPVNVGVILDFDSLFGKVGMSCIDMALSDFYASHTICLILHQTPD
ncbi:hypothetical protein DVH24_009466 [Malus domestica]|uniref:Uncharacterized protein n=1 Tax=Malus domestica TaxID=3750 RepID=A0A498ITY0_MALDO|nr:hypothetical protein DVH24_009466 [Malus domestica]